MILCCSLKHVVQQASAVDRAARRDRPAGRSATGPEERTREPAGSPERGPCDAAGPPFLLFFTVIRLLPASGLGTREAWPLRI